MSEIFKANRLQKRKSILRSSIAIAIAAAGLIHFLSIGIWQVATIFGAVMLISYWRLDAALHDKTKIEINNGNLAMRLRSDAIYTALFNNHRVVSDYQKSPYRTDRQFNMSDILAVAWDTKSDYISNEEMRKLASFIIRTKDECYTVTNGTIEGGKVCLLETILPKLKRNDVRIMQPINATLQDQHLLEERTRKNIRNNSAALSIVHLSFAGIVTMFFTAPLWSTESALLGFMLMNIGVFLAFFWFIMFIVLHVIRKNHVEIGYMKDDCIVIAGNNSSYSIIPEDVLYAHYLSASNGGGIVKIFLTDGSVVNVHKNMRTDLTTDIINASNIAWADFSTRRWKSRLTRQDLI